MTREEYIIRARRAARGYGNEQDNKKSFVSVMTAQIVICIIVFSGVMSVKNVGGVGESVKHYLNYTVDYKASVKGIVERCHSLFAVNGDA